MYKSSLNLFKKSTLFFSIPRFNFRDYRDSQHVVGDKYQAGKRSNPYKPQFSLTENEKEQNEKSPIEDRILDWDKYMKHKGQLKYTSSTFMTDVEPFPRLKIMMLCDIIMNYLKQLPEEVHYKHISYEYCKHIMKVVDENEGIIDIEEKLSGNLIINNINIFILI